MRPDFQSRNEWEVSKEWRWPWAALLFRILVEKEEEGGTLISRINMKEKKLLSVRQRLVTQDSFSEEMGGQWEVEGMYA